MSTSPRRDAADRELRDRIVAEVVRQEAMSVAELSLQLRVSDKVMRRQVKLLIDQHRLAPAGVGDRGARCFVAVPEATA